MPTRIAASALLTTFLFSGIALAEESMSGQPNQTGRNGRTIDLPCVQKIVQKRDDAIIAALSTHTTALTTAFPTRRDALVSAWGIENRQERKKTIAAAWKAFKDARKAAEKAFKEARKAAWKTFNTDRKTCRGSDEARDSNEGE